MAHKIIEYINQEASVEELSSLITSYEIKDEADYLQVKEALVYLKDKEKEKLAPITKEKKELYEPYKEATAKEKAVKADFTKVRNALSEIITPYALELTRVKELEYKEKQAEAKRELEENGVKPPEITKKADTSGLRTITTYEVEVIDINKVPREYLKQEIDRTKIIEAHKASLGVSGVKITEKVEIK